MTHLAAQVAKGVLYGGRESYHHMCRYFSGFFQHHPLLADVDYYWRVEPDVHFYCDLAYDPFRYMRQQCVISGTCWHRLSNPSCAFPSSACLLHLSCAACQGTRSATAELGECAPPGASASSVWYTAAHALRQRPCKGLCSIAEWYDDVLQPTAGCFIVAAAA